MTAFRKKRKHSGEKRRHFRAKRKHSGEKQRHFGPNQRGFGGGPKRVGSSPKRVGEEWLTFRRFLCRFLSRQGLKFTWSVRSLRCFGIAKQRWGGPLVLPELFSDCFPGALPQAGIVAGLWPFLSLFLNRFPGALPQAGIAAGLWPFLSCFRIVFLGRCPRLV